MTDVEPLIRDELARLAPFDGAVEPRWRELRPVRGRTPMLVLAAAAVLLATGATFAAVNGVPWWRSGTAPANPAGVAVQLRDVQGLPEHVDLAHARTVAADGGASLVAVPFGTTGYCLVPFVGGRASLGSQCEFQVTRAESGDDDRLVSFPVTAGAGGPLWLVYGRITDPRAASLDLTQAAGIPFALPLAPGGFFLAQVPQERWQALSGTAGPGAILDASGHTLRSGCVNWGPSPDSPDAGRGADVPLWMPAGDACKAVPAPLPPAVELDKAVKIFDVTLTEPFSIWKAGDKVSFWQAPRSSDGVPCVFPWAGPVTDSPNPPGGLDCRPVSWPGSPLMTSVSFGRLPGGAAGYGVAASGLMRPDSGISRIVLRSAGADVEAATGGGAFFVQLPNSATHALPSGGPFTLVAYDGAGNEVARESLDDLVREASPH